MSIPGAIEMYGGFEKEVKSTDLKDFSRKLKAFADKVGHTLEEPTKSKSANTVHSVIKAPETGQAGSIKMYPGSPVTYG